MKHLFLLLRDIFHNGCGLGKGTQCEPWFAMAIEFWEKRRADS